MRRAVAIKMGLCAIGIITASLPFVHEHWTVSEEEYVYFHIAWVIVCLSKMSNIHELTF